MLTGNEREALLRVADRLNVELGYAEVEDPPGADPQLGADQGLMVDLLDSEDELLVSSVRRGLAKVASAAGADGSSRYSEFAVGTALGGTEMVMRGELVSGNAKQLPALLPGFVFMVTLPIVEQERALELSRQTAKLLDGLGR